MKTELRRLALLAGVLVVVSFAMGCAGSPASSPGIGPGRWEGEIQGRVFDRSFRMPVSVQFGEPLPFENNPVHVSVGAGDPSRIGYGFLESAGRFTVSSGEVTLQYFSVETRGSQLRAVLTDEHRDEAAKINLFTAPNVTGRYAPPGPAQQLYEDDLTEIFAFLEGTELVMEVSGERLTGTLEGSGQSITGIFPLPDVVYRAGFSATRAG